MRRTISLASKILSVFLFCTLLSCQKNIKKEDDLLHAYRLIDQQRTDEAIILLESMVEQNPNNTTYRVGLASAYAHKGGIKAQILTNTIAAILKYTNYFSHAQRTPSLDGTPSDKVLGNKVSFYLESFLQFVNIFDEVPLVPPEKIVYITEALNLLRDQQDLDKNGKSYRVFLSAIYLKYLIEEDFKRKELKVDSLDKCELHIENIVRLFNDSASLVSLVFSDLTAIWPSNEKDFSAISQYVATNSVGITKAANAAFLGDQIASTYLKKSIFQFQLFGLMICR